MPNKQRAVSRRYPAPEAIPQIISRRNLLAQKLIATPVGRSVSPQPAGRGHTSRRHPPAPRAAWTQRALLVWKRSQVQALPSVGGQRGQGVAVNTPEPLPIDYWCDTSAPASEGLVHGATVSAMIGRSSGWNAASSSSASPALAHKIAHATRPG